jgi:hypothetical protein
VIWRPCSAISLGATIWIAGGHASWLAGTAQTPLPLVNRTFNRSTWGFGIAHLMAAFASSAGDLDDETSARWLKDLEDAATRGELFMSVMPMMTTATMGTPQPRRPAP